MNKKGGIHQVGEFILRMTFLIFNKVIYRMWKKKFHFNLWVASSQYLILTSQIWTNTFADAFTDFFSTVLSHFQDTIA